MKRVLLMIVVVLTNMFVFGQVREVLVNKSGNSTYPNEPTIAISRQDGSKVVVCANIDYHFASADSGKTWSEKQLESTHGVYGDPVLHATNNGKIYLTHLSKTPDPAKSKDYKFIDRMVIQRSDDGGKTFNNGAFTGYNQDKIQDKPWLSSDENSKLKGNLYISWTEFDRMNSARKDDFSRIRFSASSDLGETWSEAITISDTVGDCLDDDHTLEGATTAVDNNGTIYCVWAGHNNLYFDKSLNGGETWGKDKIIAQQKSGWTMDIPGVYRSNGMPFLLCDQNKDFLYVIYGDTLYGDADIFVIYSDDGGNTWSEPLRVNQDEQGNGKSQYLANAALDPINGDLAIVFYDRRDSKLNAFSDVYLAVSHRGESAFKEVRLNSLITGIHGESTFSGDYIDIDLYKGQLAVVWAASQQTAQLYSVVGKLDEILLNPVELIQNQIAYYTSLKKGNQMSLYFRCNQPVDVHYYYSSKKLFGLIKKSINLNYKLDPSIEGNKYVEDCIQYQLVRSFEIKIEVTNGERKVLTMEAKQK